VGCAPDLVRADEVGEVFATGDRHGLAKALREVVAGGFQTERRNMCRKAVGGYSTERAARGIIRAWEMAQELG